MRFTKEFIDRFWSHVTKGEPNECWNWHRPGKRGGYGQVKWNYKSLLAHRVAWEITHGPIPKGLMVCHHCDNPLCCNPSSLHLFLGTAKDNLQDMVKKGRSLYGERQKKAKLTDELVATFRRAYFQGEIKVAEITKRFHMDKGGILSMLYGRTWKHIAMPTDLNLTPEVSGVASLSKKQVQRIWQHLQESQYHGQINELASLFNVNRITIRRIRDGQRYAHITRPGPKFCSTA